MTIDALKAALSHLKIDNSPVSVRAKSRDFFWYFPVRKARMDHPDRRSRRGSEK